MDRAPNAGRGSGFHRYFAMDTARFWSTSGERLRNYLASGATRLACWPGFPGVKKRDDLGPGIRLLHVARKGRKGSHFIVFRASGEHTIDVLRMLYDGMDLPGHV